MTIAPWPPTRYSPPLTAEFPSVFGRYRAVFRIAWRHAMGYELEAWQEALLEHVTEVNPATGHLRRRQVLVSLGRQNGKSEIAAALGLLFLVWKRAPYVIGIASSREQAELVFKRALGVINATSLRQRFSRLTNTRGIQSKTGGLYELKPSKSAALQGIPVDLGVVDEVHLVKRAFWSDLLAGTGGRHDCLVVGITTAGDDDSELLKHLYDLVESGQAGDTFAHYVWEAPEAKIPEDDETLGAYLLAANPALAAGRVDLATVIGDVRSMPEADAIRYRLNRFVSSSNVFIGAGAWQGAVWGEGESFPTGVRPVFAVDRTPDWSWASIVVAARVEDTIWTQVVASIYSPTIEHLLDRCLYLTRHSPTAFLMESYQLRDLGLELKKRGCTVRIEGQGGMMTAASLLQSKLARGQLKHRGEWWLAQQMPRTVRRNVGDGYKISRKDSSVEIDAAIATALAAYGAEVEQDTPIGIY